MYNSIEMVRFSRKFKDIRKQCQMSQSKVALLTGVSVDTLRRIENATVIPRYKTLIILSNIFQVDLLKVFHDLTQDPYMLTYCDLMDEAILQTNQKAAQDLYDQLTKEIKINNIHQSQVDQINFQQTLAFLEARQEFFNASNTYTVHTQNLIIHALKQRNSSFSIRKLENFTYTYIEHRLLLLLAINTPHLPDQQTKILHYLNKTFLSEASDKYRLKFRLKIYFHLSLVYFTSKAYEDALTWSNYGIALAIRHKTTYLLPYLYSCRATSKFFLHKDYHQDVFSSLLMTDLFYDSSLKEKLLDIYKTYGLDVKTST